MASSDRTDLPQFGRDFATATAALTRIGAGQIGGKAAGLQLIHERILGALAPGEFPEFDVGVPKLAVLTTDLFDSFLKRNRIEIERLADQPDDRIAHALQQADLPAEYVGDLWGIADQVRTPLAVRSSSLLEDALHHPMAGVYATKMTPNNQPDVDGRFRRLVEAVKFVYASTFFSQARSYLRSIRQPQGAEKMAVIVQEVAGRKWGDRFYPEISGVARSYNYYPTGHARPEDGVVSLALGLGKEIVDGGRSWTYSPAYPTAPAPFNNIGDLLKNTQTEFWAVNMGTPPPPDPIRETEYLVRADLPAAELDGALDQIASAYDPASDRLRPGLGTRGPRVLDFAPILSLESLPLNELLRRLLAISEEVHQSPVEIEFAVTPRRRQEERARFSFLQVRPMMVDTHRVELDPADLVGPLALLASEHVLGNGVRDDVRDVVYLKPRSFEARHTPRIALELDKINRGLLAEERPYVLIGFGRWGSSDPWLGVPVVWGQVCGARVIVEATLPEMNPDLSQGSHFFHNLIGCQVLYLSVRHDGPHLIDWDWLDQQETLAETDFVKHVRTAQPLLVKVDGCHGRGVIRHHG
jgi:hypothetical protein